MSKINFEEDVANIDQTGLESVAELLREQLRLESVIENTEEQLKGYKEHLRKLSGEVIPSKMAELGMTSTTMYDGSKVDVVEDIYVSIPKDAEKSTACYQWLTDNGLGDIIKNQVVLKFGRAEDEKADQIYSDLASKGLDADRNIKVEPMTLKGFIREMIENGKDIPMETFGVYVGHKINIKKGK